MNDSTLLRISGWAAIAGGSLRVTDAALAHFYSAQALASTYFVTDVFLLAGLLGLYLSQPKATGWAGFAAFAIAAVGLLIVRSESVRFFGIGGYTAGAALTLIGVTALGVLLAVRGTQRVSAGFWLAALAVGVAGSRFAQTTRWLDAAGILFGLGFFAAGATLLRQPDRLS